METQTAERLNWRTLIKTSEETPQAVIDAFDKYFAQFVAVPLKDGENGKPEIQTQSCVGCGQVLTGLFGTWRWGIAHGVGECGNCRWPSHGHHFITDDEGAELVTLRNFILQVHPDFVERRREPLETAADAIEGIRKDLAEIAAGRAPHG